MLCIVSTSADSAGNRALMRTIITRLLGIWSILAVLVLYQAGLDIVQNLSPQGCRMSWMSPSYLLQAGFDISWSPLAARYSLWLYREVGWDPAQQSGQRRDTLPVLFIPGNAGSSHQVRSIASSATRQYYSSPYITAPAFQRSQVKPLDFFAVEFNEDLSAFHGSTLESQIAYTSSAISYILSLYPSNTKIIVVGHSMGGIVATSLLPSSNISAIITMSTPYTLPPARFDSKIDTLYDKLQLTLYQDPTPIVSICGGATDMMVSSESCILPQASDNTFRRTLFTSALEGAWTGVGHREMVWCHQVRWRVARAALELGGAGTLLSRATVLYKWLRDGHSLPLNALQAEDYMLDISDAAIVVETLAPGENLLLRNPRISKTYLLPVKRDPIFSASQQFTVLVSRGSISSVASQNPLLLQVSIVSCTNSSASFHSTLRCVTLIPDALKLIPNPSSGRVFPVPGEGSDESEGTVLYETHIPYVETEEQWIGVKVDGVDGQGWVAAGLSVNRPVLSDVSTLSLLMGKRVTINVPTNESLSTSLTFPNLLSNALAVYRMTPSRYSMPSCSDALMPPLVMHTSQATETHYFPLSNLLNRRILLHTHLDAPFIHKTSHASSSLNFTIYSSGEPGCREEFSSFDISFDWYATLGRCASRYLHTLISWAAGIVSIVVCTAWGQQERGASMPSIQESLARYGQLLFHYFLPGSLVFSVVPLPETLYLGNNGNLLLAPIAPLILLIASGLVCVSWWILAGLLSMIGQASNLLFASRRENISVPRSTIISLMTICVLVFIFVPWQVAYLGCWLLHLHTCASSQRELISLIQRSRNVAVPLFQLSGRRESDETTDDRSCLEPQSSGLQQELKRDNVNHNLHFLLLMTWLLPLTAPVLAVWVRTLLTAGLTMPFDGDHNFLAVMPFLVLTDFASWTPGRLFEHSRFETRLSLRWLFGCLAVTAFIFGSRRPYLILDVAKAVLWVIVICRIGGRYFGGSLWLLEYD